ncbi:DUF3575 domain-containing protein [Bacteroidota bacterium]
MRKLILILLILSVPIICYCQNGLATQTNHNYKLFLKADILYPAMSLFSNPTAFGVSIELVSPGIVGLQVNGIYAFSNGSTVVQKDYQIIPEFRLYLKRETKRVLFSGLYSKYNVYRYKSHGNYGGTNQELLYYKSQGIGLGGIVGYEWYLKRISFEARICVGAFKDYNIDIYENLLFYQNDMSLKLDYMAGINIGFRIF